MLETLNLEFILPELILSCGAMALLMIGVATKRERGELVLWLAILIIGAAGVFVARGEGTATLFSGSFIVDPLCPRHEAADADRRGRGAAHVDRLLARGQGGCEFEFPVLVLLATTGMMMMISANDLISLYVGLELQSLALYVVAAFNRDSARSAEAGLKYFVLGALSSGMLLYGASLVYGFTGSTDFATIAAAVQPSGANLGLIFGLVFLMAGFAFKISAVPFHMWTPDVYEGAPTPVTAFFAAAPKLAAMALTVRALITAFPGGDRRSGSRSSSSSSIASMALGSFAAIGQTNIKRLMAYSSIGHMGYALVGLAAGSAEGRARRDHLSRHLSRHDARHLRLHPSHAARRAHGRETSSELSGLVAHQPDDGFPAGDAAIFACRNPTPCRLLRQVLRVPRRHPRRPLCARGHRRRC